MTDPFVAVVNFYANNIKWLKVCEKISSDGPQKLYFYLVFILCQNLPNLDHKVPFFVNLKEGFHIGNY